MYGDGVTRSMPLGVGKSVVIDLPRDIKDVLVADPKIANAVVRTARRAYLIGVTVGQTNVFFFDGEGRQIAGFDIAVTRDLNGMRAALKRMMPEADIEVEGLAEGVILSGYVASPLEAQQAYDLAAQLAGDGAKVVNAINVSGSDQVMIRVTVAEVQRDVVRQLGINMSGRLGYGTSVVNFNTDNPFTGQRPGAERHGADRQHRQPVQRDPARHGARRRDADAGRAQPDGDFRRIRELPGRRRVPDHRRPCSQRRDKHADGSNSSSSASD